MCRGTVECGALLLRGRDARIHVVSPALGGSADLDESNTLPGGATGRQQDDRLDSWKKIATYLKRDVSTVQRWERREAMPVHRHLHDKLGSVFAFRSELDAWWEGRRKRLAVEDDSPAGPVPTTAPAVPAPPAAPISRGGRLAPLLLLAALALMATALLWLEAETDYFWRSPLANARFTRLPDFGTEQSAAITRDGKVLAFLADRDGQFDAWLSEVDRGNYRNLTHGALHDVVNPALRVLAFSAEADLVTIWTRRADGSQPGDVNIAGVPLDGGEVRPYLPNIAEFDWSHQGGRLIYHTTAPGDPLFVRERDSTGSASERRIYVAPAGVHCHFPLWSPDDAYIYFIRGVPPDDWDVWRIRPSGDGLQRITTQGARMAYPVMLDRRTLLYLATDASGAGPWLYAVDVERRRPHRISSGLETYTSLAASADGARLVATIANPHTSLWRIPLNSDATGVQAGTPAPLGGNGLTPRLAADALLYVSWRGGRQGIWVLQRGATRELWGTTRARIVGGPAVAPDGHIAFTVADNERTVLYAMERDGSRLRVLSDALSLRGEPTWTLDSKAVISAALRDGEPRLTRISVNGDAPVPLVSEYSINPVWSPDGQFLVYGGADVGTTFPLRAAAADGRPHPLPSLMLTRGARVAFFRDAHTLMLLHGQIGHMNLWLIDLQSGAQTLLAALPGDFTSRAFDVVVGGTEVVLDRVEENSDIAFIERAL